MGKKKLKQPQKNQGRLKPSTSNKKPPDQLPPLFSLRYLSPGHCISKCNRAERAAFADRLRRISQLTWAELRQAPRHGLGYEKIARNAIKPGIPRHIKDDVKFIAFRFDALKSMIGYKEGDVFHIIWLDRSFDVYDH